MTRARRREGRRRVTTPAGARRALRGRTAFVTVRGTEVWVRVAHTEILYLIERGWALTHTSLLDDVCFEVDGGVNDEPGEVAG